MMQPEMDAATVTVMLKELQEENAAAADRLIPIVFRELHNLAERYLRRERPSHTLQPTALVHEAYLRLVGDQARDWQNRAQFIAVAASIMRRLLIDHARSKQAEKRQLPESHEWHAGVTAQEAEQLLDLTWPSTGLKVRMPVTHVSWNSVTSVDSLSRRQPK